MLDFLQYKRLIIAIISAIGSLYFSVSAIKVRAGYIIIVGGISLTIMSVLGIFTESILIYNVKLNNYILYLPYMKNLIMFFTVLSIACFTITGWKSGNEMVKKQVKSFIKFVVVFVLFILSLIFLKKVNFI
ncbi:hypothetical protein [Tepidibacter aestuarii]|uniref:hypothetical protein n=1 Tax=Tepidibacter aestuarii TaxID=2925782 RepID=UPI0020C08993|nr:hypothetical protein [Tepidibacter aestuarii]CAH2213570.1 membrane protein of unknown function [Tepidibacter aestuarii]